MFRRVLIILVFVFSLIPGLIQADAGEQILEEEVGDVLVWVSYDEEKAGLGEPVPFTFNLLEKDESRSVSFESLEIQIRQKGIDRDLLAANIKKPSSEPAIFTYDFPKTGVYNFAIKYQNGKNVLAEHSFDFEISKDEQADTGFAVANQGEKTFRPLVFQYLWVATLIIGFIIGWLFKKPKFKSN